MFKNFAKWLKLLKLVAGGAAVAFGCFAQQVAKEGATVPFPSSSPAAAPAVSQEAAHVAVVDNTKLTILLLKAKVDAANSDLNSLSQQAQIAANYIKEKISSAQADLDREIRDTKKTLHLPANATFDFSEGDFSVPSPPAPVPAPTAPQPALKK